ncbi:MAG: TonB-dependent siderophore receptor [Oscillatoriaceae cyanobacterium]
MRKEGLFHSVLLAGTAAMLAATPARGDVRVVTGVQLNRTPEGLEVILETSSREKLRVFSATYGQVSISDVINTELDLSGGSAFEVENPAPGISAITVSPLDRNSIRVKVVGSEAAAIAQFNAEEGKLIFSVPPSSSTARMPDTPSSPPSPRVEETPSPPPSPRVEEREIPTLEEWETPGVEGMEMPSEEGQMPPVEGQMPPVEGQMPPVEGQMPPVEGQMPPEGVPEVPSEKRNIIEIIVTATRTAERLTDVPRSITVVKEEQIEQQSRMTRDLGTIISQQTPGLSVGTQSGSNFGQTLRGRDISVLIDGVPQSTNRNAARDLRNIDPSAIERVEVLRGPTAIYGDGATGGVINIITKTGGGEGVRSRTLVEMGTFPSDFSDALGQNIQQSFSGSLGKADFVLSGSFNNYGSTFDADGSRLPPDPNGQGGLSDTRSLNLLSKFGVNFTDAQRLQFTVNYFRDEQDTDYTSDPIVNTIPGRQKARALRGLDLDESQQTNNLNLSMDYTNDNIWGSSLHAQLYFRDYLTRFFPFDARNFASLGNTIFQSRVESEKYGGRVQVDTPLYSDKASLLWGVDYVRENTNQPVSVFDPEAFQESNGLVYNKIGDRTWSPLQRQNNVGLFAQLEMNLTERFLMRGGVRHEEITIDVDDYTTIAGNRIQGGELDYSATVFNIGAVVYTSDEISLFGNFSQGFSLADVGRVLRSAPAGFTVNQLEPEAQKVNNYEIGIRGNYDRVQASLSGFYNTSNLGTSFTQDFQTVRAPERVYGLEFALDAQPSDTWAFGTSLTWSEGGADFNEDGDYESPLNGFRISPIKITAYLENETVPGWRNRLQALYSGNRNPSGQGFGLGEVYSYITLDLVSSLKVGPGTLVLGVENLLDTDYFPVVSQLQATDTAYTAGRGRTVRLGYSWSW